MHLEKIFYGFGLVFVIATILHLAWEYNLSDVLKSIVLICVAIVLFFVGEVLRHKDL